MVNTKHDAASYESCGYQRDISDGNALYDAFRRAEKGSDWKPQVQRFEMTYLLGLSEIQGGLQRRDYHFLPSSTFVLNERGKTRFINGEQLPDRIVKHSLCDEVLSPAVRNFLIYDNGASTKGKGIDFTRRRLLTHLRRYYARRGSNEGYILLVDFSKYYDNILHDALLNILTQYVSDDCALWLLHEVLKRAEVDVSYMTDKEFSLCLFEVFNSLDYMKIDKRLLTGAKMMRKHMNIGDQVAQIAGISYPIPLDNYIKIVKGVHEYARYMDDSYTIHESKMFLEDLAGEVVDVCAKLGIHVNTRKTRVCKLSDYWRFLQVQYSLTETGRVIQKINPKRITAMRRKMKKLIYVLSPKDFTDWYTSWFRAHYQYMSKLQRENLTTLFNQLKEEQECLPSNSATGTS